MDKSTRDEKKTAQPDAQKPLVEQAYQQIREKIIRLQFLPGQYLNEAAICEKLGLGRTPVHQALQLLQLEGLIEILPRKGVVVQPDGVLEIRKILDSRLIIEPELARMAAEHAASDEISETDLADLVALAEAPDEMLEPPDIDGFIASDRAFHRKINECSGNHILGEFATGLHERCCRFWYLNLWQTLNVEVSKNKHIDIAKAVLSGDGDAAAEAMRSHIMDLSERLKRLPPNAFGVG
ncbi:DNA-binding transcriptional regulator, GntR family [Paracoccus halophilus]|uniref:DNA-binding transcriptional regulator, GntR family n=1 Tax=Paracoccus halophilus TaxID=376733 RepID=A0A1I0TN00_9RHOB|nr:GntR family transcriptional regulator [Paracoccus halophilus]SFA53125.1 DNA-binding transcriptional regulator, GntR family [Paracoccus halophilus]